VELERMKLRHQINALAALGRIDELDVLLDSLVALPLPAENIMGALNGAVAELRAHGHRDAALVLAQRMLDWLEARSRGEVGQMEEEITWPWYNNWRGICLFRLERYEEALPVFEEIGRDDRPEDWQGSALAAYISAVLGNHERGRAHLERSPRSHYGPGLNAVMGNREEAMRLLHERFQRVRFRNQWMDQFHRAQSLDSLRGYPPFERFMRPRG
jgi:tetratricopeptide (TPR) repeat protein